MDTFYLVAASGGSDSKATASSSREADIKRLVADDEADLKKRIIELEEEIRIFETQHSLQSETSPAIPASNAFSQATSLVPPPNSAPSLNSSNGNEPPSILPLLEMFPAVDTRFFYEIWSGTFDPADLAKLSNDWVDRHRQQNNTTPAKFRSIAQFALCMEVYGQTVLEFTLPRLRGELSEALSTYRHRVYQNFTTYTFDSVILLNKIFLYGRLNQGQDRADGWRTVDRNLESRVLVKKRPRRARYY
ncbi:MAG: hypothetical protein Q9191_006213 [Dirinaria sp. TL-2023a]